MVETLIERLRGIYRIPITDGLGAVGAGEEPDNPNEFVRKFETAPIQHEAADRLEALERENKELRKKLADERIVAEKAHEADAKAFLAAITRAETAERQLAEAQGWAKEWHRTCETIATLMDLPEPEGATFAQAVSDKLAERDADLARVRVALEDACDQILDSYRTWVADHITAFPRPGQIPRYDRARAALAGSGDGWREMSSAPKIPGAVYLGWNKTWRTPETIDWDETNSTWCIPFLRPTAQPTHWMPLPASPSTAGER